MQVNKAIGAFGESVLGKFCDSVCPLLRRPILPIASVDYASELSDYTETIVQEYQNLAEVARRYVEENWIRISFYKRIVFLCRLIQIQKASNKTV